MRQVTSKACLAAVLCLLLAHQARGDTMRCGNRIIQRGDSAFTVKRLCGAPASVEQTFTRDYIPMEIWTYNRGPQHFLVTIRIINGKVVAIETLHQYGQ